MKADHWPLSACSAGTDRAGRGGAVSSAGRSVTIHTHASPDAALKAAAAAADPADRIVVFGSFFTVGGVLKDGLPRLAARHLG
jgi:dihydrofolate synthase/folylpolyglutamate synthase